MMKPEWKTFLTDAGAEFDGEFQDQVASFGNPEREKRFTLTGTLLCDLSHFGLVEVHGDDAEAFLQGQTTNDVTHVTSKSSSLGAYCNPKGRILANYRMFRRKDTIYLMLPVEMVEATLKRLQMFVMMSKVTIADAGSSLVRFGLSGSDAEQELESALGVAPKTADQVLEKSGITVIRVRGEAPRFVLLGESDAMADLWNRLNVRAAPVGASSWRLLDIMAGVPTIYQLTTEAFVPQMMNLELLEGVSFKKGCYTGQEIVARMHYLGKLKKRMYRLHFEEDEMPVPGALLYSAEDKTNQPIGTIVDSAPYPDGGVESLAVVTIKYADPDKPINLESAAGLAAKLYLPPYDLELKES